MLVGLAGCDPPAITSSDAEGPQPTLVAEQLSPPQGKTPTADPGRQVEFVYSVTNTGESAVEGLKVLAACSCTVAQGLPGRLAAHESARVRVLMTAPPAGRSEKRLRIVSDPAIGDLALLRPAVAAAWTLPHIGLPPEGYRFTSVASEAFATSLVIRTVQRSRDPRLIRQITSEGAGGLKVRLCDVSDLPLEDAEVTRRNYLVTVAAEALATPIDARLVLTLNSGETRSVPFRVTVLDSVVIAPPRLAFERSSDATREVALLHRSAKLPSILVASPTEGIELDEIRAAEHSKAYRVRIKSDAPVGEFAVRFELEGGRVIELPVTIRDSASG